VRAAFVTGGSGFIGGMLVRRLLADGWTVRALARDESSATGLGAMGAEPVRGDLGDLGAMEAGAQGCELAFHCAAHLGDWGPREAFELVNVVGTGNALAACASAGVRRFVHVSTEAVLLAGQPLVEADERAPLRFDSPAPYAATKARAEAAAVAAAHEGFDVVVVRPRMVWGTGDTTILPVLAELVRSGRFAWIGGGRHLTSTTHVDNVVHGLLLAAEKGMSGGVYFVTDGHPLVFRDFVTRLLATQGLEPPERSVPYPVAASLAAAAEAAWGVLPERARPPRPPLTRFGVWAAGLEATVDATRARTELGYAPVRTVDEGMSALQREHLAAAER
jgi:nucleoside-diphosphate-sugar epimerase